MLKPVCILSNHGDKLSDVRVRVRLQLGIVDLRGLQCKHLLRFIKSCSLPTLCFTLCILLLEHRLQYLYLWLWFPNLNFYLPPMYLRNLFGHFSGACSMLSLYFPLCHLLIKHLMYHLCAWLRFLQQHQHLPAVFSYFILRCISITSHLLSMYFPLRWVLLIIYQLH